MKYNTDNPLFDVYKWIDNDPEQSFENWMLRCSDKIEGSTALPSSKEEVGILAVNEIILTYYTVDLFNIFNRFIATTYKKNTVENGEENYEPKILKLVK